jgi:hypothetical protein
VRPRRVVAGAIARLPRPVTRRIDAIYGRVSPGWSYNADGLATIHLSPFLEDREFSELYDRMARDWFRDEPVDVRWRMWLLTRFALQARNVPGHFAEFGVYRGGCAWMILSTAGLDANRRFHLFDTYAGIPESNLTELEAAAKFGGRLSDTSVDYVANLLDAWSPIPRLWPGDVFETVPATDTGPLAFVHLDLNASAPTGHVLEHVFDRVSAGGVIVFDDYGWREYGDQRRVIDDFLRGRPEVLVALPTGQAVLTKTGR